MDTKKKARAERDGSDTDGDTDYTEGWENKNRSFGSTEMERSAESFMGRIK